MIHFRYDGDCSASPIIYFQVQKEETMDEVEFIVIQNILISH